MNNNHMKKLSLVLQEMYTETTMKYYNTTFRMAKIKKYVPTKC